MSKKKPAKPKVKPRPLNVGAYDERYPGGTYELAINKMSVDELQDVLRQAERYHMHVGEALCEARDRLEKPPRYYVVYPAAPNTINCAAEYVKFTRLRPGSFLKATGTTSFRLDAKPVPLRLAVGYLKRHPTLDRHHVHGQVVAAP